MPLPRTRSREVTADALADWIAAQLETGERVTVDDVRYPRGTGFSSETILFDATLTGASGPVRRALVARVLVPGHELFPKMELDTQRRVMTALWPTAVPVPEVLWAGDAQSSPFGQPILVMDRVPGQAPADAPPYPERGWLAEMAPPQQREVFAAGVGMLAKIHSVDWRGAGLEFLTRDGRDPGLGAELDYYGDYLRWATPHERQPLLEDALTWLRRCCPPAGEVCLNWGDAKLPNIMFDGPVPTAALDWELAHLSPPEADVAFWCAYHQSVTAGHGIPDLPGALTNAETVALYERLTGRTLKHLAYFDVWAVFRIAVIVFRLTALLIEVGRVAADAESLPYHSLFRQLEQRLEAAAAAGEPA